MKQAKRISMILGIAIFSCLLICNAFAAKTNANEHEEFGYHFFVAVLGIAIVGIVAGLISHTKSKPKELMDIIEMYSEIKKDERCKKAIRESGIIPDLLAFSGEYLFIPLKREKAGYSLRFDKKAVNNAEKQCETNIVSMLMKIVWNEKNQDQYKKTMCNIWGSIKDGKRNITGYKDLCNAYNKTLYLFSSLVSSGIIAKDELVTRDAFFLLLWECALERNSTQKKAIEKYVKDIIAITQENDINDHYGLKAFMNSKKSINVASNYQVAVFALYEIMDMKPDDIYIAFTAKDYIDIGNEMWISLCAKNKKNVELIVDEIEKRRYVDNLLKSDGKPKVTIQEVDAMNPASFEKLVEVLFSKMGYEAQTTKLSGDQGVDVIAEKKGKRAVIQAKCYSYPVSNTAVQEVVAGKGYYNADEAYVITNNIFTRSAKELANANNVVLWDRTELIEKLEHFPINPSEIGL